MVLDEKAAEKLYNRLCLIESDNGSYRIAFENESLTLKNVLSPGNRWLMPDAYLRIFGKKFMKDMGFNVDKRKSGTKRKSPRKRIKQIEQYTEKINYNAKQSASELNKLLTSEDNQDNIMLQDTINKNEIAADNSIKLIETSLAEIGVEASTQTETGGLKLIVLSRL